MAFEPSVQVKNASTAAPHTIHTHGEEAETQDHAPLPLPPPPSDEEAKYNLDMSRGSATATLDHLGPLVVHQDGTLSRIANWEQMTDTEKRNTLRVLGKRNQLRQEALKGHAGDM